MADVKISELPVASTIASPDVAPIVQGGVTKQADVGLFAGLLGSISDQQIAFGNGTAIAGSDDFKWNNDDTALELGGSSFSISDTGNIRVPKAFTIEARNNADDENIKILEKKVTSGHDNLIIGEPSGNTHGYIELNGTGNKLRIIPATGGDIEMIGQNVTITTDKANGYNLEIFGDAEIHNGGWLLLGPQLPTWGNGPFEGVIYADSSTHHVYYYNGATFKQFAEVGDPIIFPDSDPHVAGAGYWSGGVLTRSNG